MHLVRQHSGLQIDGLYYHARSQHGDIIDKISEMNSQPDDHSAKAILEYCVSQLLKGKLSCVECMELLAAEFIEYGLEIKEVAKLIVSSDNVMEHSGADTRQDHASNHQHDELNQFVYLL